VGVASEFLDDGLVLYQIDGTGHRREFPVRSGGVATEIRVVVLADAHSASGSEVLIGAFQDHERAPVIGTRTFGKGSVNELKKLQDGSGLYLTSALWHTPEGRLIEGEGLEPDILVFNEQLLRSDNTRIFIDRQLEAAIGLLAEPLGTNDGPDSN
jgi:carboxyl-terminal processing protease